MRLRKTENVFISSGKGSGTASSSIINRNWVIFCQTKILFISSSNKHFEEMCLMFKSFIINYKETKNVSWEKGKLIENRRLNRIIFIQIERKKKRAFIWIRCLTKEHNQLYWIVYYLNLIVIENNWINVFRGFVINFQHPHAASEQWTGGERREGSGT